MADKTLNATHSGELHIGSITISCAVLDDGTRVLSQGEFLEALGRHRKANVRKGGVEERVPPILQGKAINPFISEEILEKSRPISFRTTEGVRASGYRADLLPSVCEVYLQARDAGVLPQNQEHVAKQADILMRGLAHVGIIALVDEATGFQEIRDREALQAILDKYLRDQYAKWAKTFPDEFYQQIFRLRGWQWKGMKVNRPSVVAHYTNDIVYARLAPGVLEELQRLNPRVNGKRARKNTQWLTEDIGIPALKMHLNGVTAIMRGSTTWDQTMRMIQRAFPKINTNLEIPFPEND
jgi:hypothetical protein